jgi:hypothetical protein
MAKTGRDGFMNAKNINIHIDSIVLDGISVPYHEQPLLQEAVETELARLFSVNGLDNALMTGGAVSHISAGDIQLTDEGDQGHLGQQIAQAVYEGINR